MRSGAACLRGRARKRQARKRRGEARARPARTRCDAPRARPRARGSAAEEGDLTMSGGEEGGNLRSAVTGSRVTNLLLPEQTCIVRRERHAVAPPAPDGTGRAA